jgi:hypothetical protein
MLGYSCHSLSGVNVLCLWLWVGGWVGGWGGGVVVVQLDGVASMVSWCRLEKCGMGPSGASALAQALHHVSLLTTLRQVRLRLCFSILTRRTLESQRRTNANNHADSSALPV